MSREEEHSIKPADLRGILRYVPLWRGHIFVIAIDSGVVHDDNFINILLDIAVLHNLNIKVVVVYGIGDTIARIAKDRNLQVSDTRGEGPIDAQTLRVAVESSGLVGHEIMQGLTQNGLKCVLANAVRATEMGVLSGQDQIYSGKVEKIDVGLVQRLIENGIVPVLPPIAFSRDGLTLRLNSDLLAAEAALSLKASKLIYLAPGAGLSIRGEYQVNVPVQEIAQLLDDDPLAIDEPTRSKARHAVATVEGGVPRAHIIDGRLYDGLLTEIFSKVGVGTMIYANEYTQIRAARRKDAHAISNITQNAVRDQSLRKRTRHEIEKEISNFFVYEIDGSIIGSASLKPYAGGQAAELEAVYVQPFYQGRGVGRKLVDYALSLAIDQGFRKVFALSTQSSPFFRTCGFEPAGPDELPAERRELLEKSGRRSRVLVCNLKRLKHDQSTISSSESRFLS